MQQYANPYTSHAHFCSGRISPAPTVQHVREHNHASQCNLPSHKLDCAQQAAGDADARQRAEAAPAFFPARSWCACCMHSAATWQRRHTYTCCGQHAECMVVCQGSGAHRLACAPMGAHAQSQSCNYVELHHRNFDMQAHPASEPSPFGDLARTPLARTL